MLLEIGLTSITLPNSVTIINIQCFENCQFLTSVILPNNPLFEELKMSMFQNWIKIYYNT